VRFIPDSVGDVVCVFTGAKFATSEVNPLAFKGTVKAREPTASKLKTAVVRSFFMIHTS
jgi:creatinine amidohydrolase/Fe(II)-dependent formamide hydrolase-like protein